MRPNVIRVHGGHPPKLQYLQLPDSPAKRASKSVVGAPSPGSFATASTDLQSLTALMHAAGHLRQRTTPSIHKLISATELLGRH